MSRVGKQIITIPTGVEVKLGDGTLMVKGPLGTLNRVFRPDITFQIADGTVKLEPRRQSIFHRALWGTYASHVQNMITGVTKGFSKKLLIEGIGYKANVAGQKIVLDLGASHQIEVVIPEGAKVVAEKGQLTVSGNDKELVGALAAKVRALKPTEPYKGKGIRYEGEVVRRKQGKKSTA